MECGRWVWRIVGALALAVGMAACGGQTPALHTGPTELQTGSADGPRVVSINRAVHDAMVLSLFLDAGNRDAKKAATAALTASLMAQAAGADAQGVTYPDGIEVSVRCRPDSLDACVGRLAQAIALRDVPAAALTRARQQLAEVIDTQRADDDAHALTLAIEDIVGEGTAAGLLPLADARALSEVEPTDVEDFLRAHAGPGRALLVASGSVIPSALRAAVDAHFRSLPRAQSRRASRAPFPAAAAGSNAEVADGPRHVLGLAFLGPRLSQVEAACQAAARDARLEAQPPTLSGCAAMPLRGNAISLLTASAPVPEPLLRLAAQAQANLDLESRARTGEAEAPSLLAENRREGLRFMAGEQTGSYAGLGVGLLTPRPASALQSALAQVRRVGAGPTLQVDGDEREAQADVDSPAGVAHIHVRARPSKRATLVIGRSPGSAEDPGTMHGRAALLATLAATHCDGLEQGTLQAQLAELNAELAPLVGARRWGLSLTLPAEHLNAGQALLLRCALHPSMSRAHVADARLVLRSRLQAHGPDRPQHRDALSHHLLPRAPGELSPVGTTDEVARIGSESLQRMLSTRRELTLAIVAPGDARARLRGAARTLAIRSLLDPELPAARTANETPKTGGPAGSKPTPGSLPALEPALVVLHVQGTEAGGAAGAQAAALTLQTALTEVLQLPASDAAGGSLPGGGYAAAVIQLAAPLPSDFPARLHHALTTLGVPEALVARLHEEDAWRWDTATESPSGEALVLAGFRRPGARPSLQAALSLAQQLVNSVPQVRLVSP